MRDPDEFRISSFCSGGHCLGLNVDGDVVEIAKVADPVTTLSVSREEWAAFVAGVKNGEFDLD